MPTVIARRGDFYIGNLGLFPQDAGTSNIWRINAHGRITRFATGFNLILGLTFDRQGRLYVLQNSQAPAPAPGTGSVVRLSRNGHRALIVDGLFLPTGMTFGPDGNLYISNVGFGAPPVGMGQVLKVELHD